MNRIRLEGCLPGATILVRSIGPTPRLVANAVATGAIRERIDLLPGIRLAAGDRLVARQELGATNSEWTVDTLAVPVAAAPTSHDALAALAFSSRLFQCGARVVIGGAVPGAWVSVSSATGIIAEGAADEDGTRLDLTGAYPSPGQPVSVQQSAPLSWPALLGTPKVTTKPVLALPLATRRTLPPPKLKGVPPKGCDDTLELTDVFDGATVTVSRSSTGASESATFGKSSVVFGLNPPVDRWGDRLQISQAMLRCEIEGQPDDIECLPADAPISPFVHPPCPGTTLIELDGLNRGSTITVKVNEEEFLGIAPRDRTSASLEVVPVPPGASIQASQARCGFTSTPPFITHAATLLVTGPPDLSEPLFGCARVVRVTAATPGASIRVWMSGPNWDGPISNILRATSDTRRVRVVPYLQPGHQVWVEQLACGGPWLPSTRKTVLRAPIVGPPNITIAPIAGSRRVLVDAIPGAFVELFDEAGNSLGMGEVDNYENIVFVDEPLREGDLIHAQQTLCNTTSEPGPSIRVISGERVFFLAHEIVWPSPVASDEEVVCDRAIVTCRHDGSWKLEAHFQNKAEEADVQLLFEFTFHPNGAPPFGFNHDLDLSASGDGRVTKIGFRILGIPPDAIVVRSGVFLPFQDPIYWVTLVLSTAPQFRMLAAWRTYEGVPEEPEGPDEE